jgi:hypothetical protein
MEVIPKPRRADLIKIPTFLLQSLNRYHCWVLLVPEGIFCSVVSASILNWFIKYMYLYAFLNFAVLIYYNSFYK